ncbi:unnamed protein product, partial [Polarella glacialis]
GNCLFSSTSLYKLLDRLIWLEVDEDTCWERYSSFPHGWWKNNYFTECLWAGYERHISEALGRQRSAPGCGGRSADLGPSRTLGLHGTDRQSVLK